MCGKDMTAKDYRRLFSCFSSLFRSDAAGCILFRPFDGPVERLFGGWLVKPDLVVGDDARGPHQPHAVFNLFHGDGSSGVLFAERNLSAGADCFYLCFHGRALMPHDSMNAPPNEADPILAAAGVQCRAISTLPWQSVWFSGMTAP